MTLMEPVVTNMFAYVPKSEPADFRIRIPDSLKARWDQTCERKKITSQDAGAALMSFFLELPDLVQSGVLGQIDKDSQRIATRLVMEMLAGEKKPPRRTRPFKEVAELPASDGQQPAGPPQPPPGKNDHGQGSHRPKSSAADGR